MAGTIALVATLTEPPSRETVPKIPDAVTWLEIREDLVPGVSAAWLRNHFAGKLLYTLPIQHSDSQFARHQTLVRTAPEYDMLSLDADCDLSPEVLSAIPVEKRLICWKGPSGDLAYLRSTFARISAVPAHAYSMIIKNSGIIDAIKPLLLLKELGRRDVIATCEGKSGFWSRVLAPQFGAPLVFGRLDEKPVSDSGEPSIRQLMEDYGFPAVHPVREVYGIVGNRVFQSPSPRLHNAGYRVLDYPALFLPFHVESFEDFWQGIIEASALEQLGLAIKGLTIVSPYKEAACAAAALRSPVASKAGASNIFVKKNGSWEAHTTDPESIAGVAGNGHKSALPFTAAVIGCGGAGRAIAATLQQAGAHVTLVNRGKARGELAVRLLGLPFVPLSDFQATHFSLLVNATPVGRDDGAMPFEIDTLSRGTLVVDLVYGTRPTPLVEGVIAR